MQRSLNKLTVDNWHEAWAGKVADRAAATRVRRKTPPDRLASQHFLQDINHAFQSEGKRLRDFGGQEDLLADEAPLKKPRTLVVCSDQESVQIAALNFARHHRRLFIEHIKDPGHRCWNDTWGALSDSHLAKTAMILLNVYNVKYGPWNKSGWFARVQETAKTLSQQRGPNDPLLQKFFPAILADSRRDESENTEQERKEFLQSLPTLHASPTKGLRRRRTASSALCMLISC